jgi:hypothetical protein
MRRALRHRTGNKARSNLRVLRRKVCILIIKLLLLHGLSASGQQLHHIVVRLMNRGDSSGIPSTKVNVIGLNGNVITSSVTDQQGICTIAVIDTLDHKIRLHAQPTGFDAYTSDILSFTGVRQEINLYLLTNKTIQLSEVSILQQQLIRDGGKLVYRIKQDQFSAAVNVPELLSKLPGVIVVNGNVRLNGQLEVLILIDGKGEQRSQQQQLSILSAMSSDQIDKIEVISFSPARYDANVMAVINVITKKEKSVSNIKASYFQPLYMDNKYFGNGYASGGTSTNINFKINGVKGMLILGADNLQRLENEKSLYVFDNAFKYNSLNKSGKDLFKISEDLTLDYDINAHYSIGFNFNLYYVLSNIISTTEQYTFSNIASHNIDSVVTVSNLYRRNQRTIQTTGNFKYLLNTKKNSNIYVSFIYSGNPDKTNNSLLSRSSIQGTSIIQSRFSGNTDIGVASMIFSDVIKSTWLSTEFGMRSNTLRNNTSQALNNSTYSDFHYEEQISSGFFSVRWDFGKIMLASELRGEFLNSSSVFRQTDSVDQHLNKNYFKIYPHFLLHWNLVSDWSISIGYMKKIRRPFLGDINPTQRINTAFTNQSGNIDFMPTYFDRIEGQLLHRNTVMTLRYELSSNKRIFIPTDNLFEFRATNLEKSRLFGVSLSQTFKLAECFTSNVVVNYAYSSYLKSEMKYFNNNTNLFETSISNELLISKKIRIQLSFYYNASMHLEYSIHDPFFTTSCTMKQILLKDKLFLNVSVNDPTGQEKNRSRSFFPKQFNQVEDVSNNRSFSFQLIFNFATGKKFKQQKYKIKNEGEIRGLGI